MLSLFTHNTNHLVRRPWIDSSKESFKKGDVVITNDENDNIVCEAIDIINNLVELETFSGEHYFLPVNSVFRLNAPKELFDKLEYKLAVPMRFIERMIELKPDRYDYVIQNYGDKIIFKMSSDNQALRNKVSKLNPNHDYISLLITPFRSIYFDTSYGKYQSAVYLYLNKIFQGFHERDLVEFYSVDHDFNDFNKFQDQYNIHSKKISENVFKRNVEKVHHL